jgi:hypothetical protein
MFKYLIVGVALVVGIVAAVLFTRPADVAALNVKDVLSDPAAYSGTFTLAGITAAFSPSDGELFGIMDVSELQCTSPNCHKPVLPVRFGEKLPAMGDEVRVTGSFKLVPGGYLFMAEKVAVVRNHKIGG